MASVNYRFYVLDRDEHIIKVRVAGCEGTEDIERTAAALLAEHVDSAAIEVWDRQRPVHRAERSKVAS